MTSEALAASAEHDEASAQTAPLQGAQSGRVVVSVIIKALNEEHNIVAAIEHALRAVTNVGGEVILADSASTDRTVELAAQFPIRVVTLANPGERCCGVGPQLGYQNSRGEFVYIVDGDMKMREGFLERATAFMREHPGIGGVGGLVFEHNSESLEYRRRAETTGEHMSPGPVDRLDGGGLYRREAIQQLGYLSDRNLHSYEEFDLAARLRSTGWGLYRLPIFAVDHHGHDSPPYTLLMRRWRSRYAFGIGELVRAAGGRPHAGIIWREVRELRLYVAVLGWWLVLGGVLVWPMTGAHRSIAFAAALAAPLLVMAARKRSLRMAVYSITSWCVNTAALVRGVMTPLKPPKARISDRLVSDRVRRG